MNAAELVALAAARGIDLTHIGGTATDTKGIARERQKTAIERRQRLEVLESVKGRDSRSYRRATWTHAELGMAAEGVPELPWKAARYSWAGDWSCYSDLWYGLTCQAARVAKREGWKPQVMGVGSEPRFYLQELAALVLDHDAHMAYFVAAPTLYAIYMHVDERTWKRILEKRFEYLKGHYLVWLETARGIIQRRLNGDQRQEDRRRSA